jgi:CIC family chloride channel protein
MGVMLRDASSKTFTPIVVSAVIATTLFNSLSRVAAGQASRGIFQMPPDNGAFVFTFHELPNYVLLGIYCGLLAIAFTYAMHFVEKGTERLRPVPQFLKPAIGAGLSGVCGVVLILIFHDDALVHHRFMENAYVPIFGGGYPTILRAIDPTWYAANGHVVDGRAAALGLEFLLIACVLKMVATAFTLGTGGSGGLFAPALFVGACGGGAFGLVLLDGATRGAQCLRAGGDGRGARSGDPGAADVHPAAL